MPKSLLIYRHAKDTKLQVSQCLSQLSGKTLSYTPPSIGTEHPMSCATSTYAAGQRQLLGGSVRLVFGALPVRWSFTNQAFAFLGPLPHWVCPNSVCGRNSTAGAMNIPGFLHR